MSDGIKPTRIEREGYALPDEVSIDGDYTGDDVDWDSSPGMLGFDQWKQPVRAATTAAITIATALNNGDTLDGVTLATGDRVLVKDQGASAEQNGIYIVGTTPARADDLDEDAEVLGAVVYVIDGTANAGTIWTVTNDAATIVDTDDINWAQLSGGGGGVTVADEGTPLSTTATTLDFVGAGVTASGTGATKTITIPGGSGIVVKDEGSTLTTDATTLDFVGSGVVASGTGTTKTITIAGGGSVTWLPPIVQAAAAYQNSSTTNAVTLGSTPTKALVAMVAGTNRGATSISQTNVTWTQRYTGNGNSQYGEIWTGAITGAAGTTVTANFASGTRSEVHVFEVDVTAFTSVGTAVTSTSGGSTQMYSGFLTSPSSGDLCVYLHCTAGAGSSMGSMNIPFYAYGYAGGQGVFAMFYHRGAAAFMTRILDSSVAWFTAMMKVS